MARSSLCMARSGHAVKMARSGEAQPSAGRRRSAHADALRRGSHDSPAPQRRHGRGGGAVRTARGRVAAPPLRRREAAPLGARELAELARVDGAHHVLVAYVPGDPAPAGLAQLVRDGTAAEVAFAVADEHQGRGIGRVLCSELEALARAAGIRELHAVVCGANPPAVALMRGGRPSWDGGELELVVGL
ncbi:MAG TPA: GNAT family N-acetyltransferase [Gaiellaceae bacterium]|nr:GNAT family N-acetyltransferase [Gaiellaceae bacterium]